MWQFIDGREVKYFQLCWCNYLMIYTTIYGGKKILRRFNPLFLKQIHSCRIINPEVENERFGDGLIAQRQNITLGVRVADCLPVYLFNEEKFCIIHCGWRGILKGIAQEARKLLGEYNYALGASIDVCCYEVKEDVVQPFTKRYKQAIIEKEGRFFLDLKTAVIIDLGMEGLLSSLDFCTKCHPEYFYSYRRGDRQRNYALITRVDN